MAYLNGLFSGLTQIMQYAMFAGPLSSVTLEQNLLQE